MKTGEISIDRLAFGPFQLDLNNSRVSRDGLVLELRPQAFHVLRLLLKRSGSDVDYEDLIREAWGGTIVSRHTVATTIGAVRHALGEYGSWITYRPKLGYRFQVPDAEELLQTGWHYWNRLTREGVEKALELFQQAALKNPYDAAAFDGISSCYMTLATFGMRAPTEVYGEFCEAQRRAVILAGLTPKISAKHARLLYVFERKFAAAEAELRALFKRGAVPTMAYLNFAMLLASRNRLDEAAEAVSRARLSDPLYPTLPATEVFIHFCRREFDAAVVCGKRGMDLHPHQTLGRAYYAQALELCGTTGEALAQYRLASVISPDMLWLKALEAKCLVRSGNEGEALKLYEELEQARFTEYVDAYYMALLADALGKRVEAFEDLELALEEHSPTVYMLDVDPRLDSLRADPRFSHIRAVMFADADAD